MSFLGFSIVISSIAYFLTEYEKDYRSAAREKERNKQKELEREEEKKLEKEKNIDLGFFDYVDLPHSEQNEIDKFIREFNSQDIVVNENFFESPKDTNYLEEKISVDVELPSIELEEKFFNLNISNENLGGLFSCEYTENKETEDDELSWLSDANYSKIRNYKNY